jgi:hypothetical protein
MALGRGFSSVRAIAASALNAYLCDEKPGRTMASRRLASFFAARQQVIRAICCRGTGDQAYAAMRAMMTRLKPTVNETKTKLCRVPDETFDFLGYTFGKCYSAKTWKGYIGTRPAQKKIRRLRDLYQELGRVRHRQTKEPATDRLHLTHRATSRLYLDRDKPGSWRNQTSITSNDTRSRFCAAQALPQPPLYGCYPASIDVGCIDGSTPAARVSRCHARRSGGDRCRCGDRSASRDRCPIGATAWRAGRSNKWDAPPPYMTTRRFLRK